MMSKLDLRQIGTIMGLPIYIDLASERPTERDAKEFVATMIMQKAFDMQSVQANKKRRRKM